MIKNKEKFMSIIIHPNITIGQLIVKNKKLNEQITKSIGFD